MDILLENCSAAILAGGENKRMPVLKAFIEVSGQAIIENTLDLMKALFREVFIVTNCPGDYSHLGSPMLGDIYDTRGPMTGIFTALLNSSNRWTFVSACDMPFLNKNLIPYMASQRTGYDAVVPISPHTPFSKGEARDRGEPLFALYSKHLMKDMEEALLSGDKSLSVFLKNKRVKYIPSSEIMKIDSGGRSFVNLNSPQDIYLYLKPEDRLRFKIKAGRRGNVRSRNN